MTVEEADLPLGPGHESGHKRHDNEKLNETCVHVRHLLS
jgi:hypothetical protein